jgi:Arabinose efflux permease
LFVDFKSAYDSVIKSPIFKAMQEFQIPKKLISLMEITLKTVKCRIKFGNDLSEPFMMDKVLKQGDDLSCLLFNIAPGKIIRNAKLETKGKISIYCGVGLIVSWTLFSLLPYHFAFYIIALLILYASLSAVHVTNQSIVFKLNQELRSRFNAIYMTGYFAGGALGTTAGSYAWKHFGWTGVCILGLIFAILCLYYCVSDAKNQHN